MTGGSQILHAGCVALNGRGLLILGASGAGKSALALSMMALGARLVADDRTILTVDGDALIATCPATLRGLIEARGIGILHAEALDAAPLVLAVDMDQTEAQRLPPLRSVTFLNRTITLVHSVPSPHFPAALVQYLRAGRQA
ncbi:MAG: serine kinase [Rhodobacteraceae bacterium PARR1]|nr:MAG: serine kinase [Rhodobacteraceae bacterium PARR1]